MSRNVRISDSEREALIEALRTYLTEGRLTLDEFEQRVAIVFGAILHSEADLAFAELPSPPAGRPSPAPGKGVRHGETPIAKPHWRQTAEVFRDPTTGRVMRVWVDPADGARHYVAE